MTFAGDTREEYMRFLEHYVCVKKQCCHFYFHFCSHFVRIFCPPLLNPLLGYLSSISLSFCRLNAWSQEGCFKMSNGSNVTICHCYHLTTFASLMQVTTENNVSSNLHPRR